MRISDWSSDVCSSDLLIVRNQHRTRHVTGIKLGLGAYIENQRWMLGLQLLRQLSRQDRFAGGNHERAQQRSNNDYRRTQMHDKTFCRWCRHPGSNWGPTAYKAVALPTELCRRGGHSNSATIGSGDRKSTSLTSRHSYASSMPPAA